MTQEETMRLLKREPDPQKVRQGVHEALQKARDDYLESVGWTQVEFGQANTDAINKKYPEDSSWKTLPGAIWTEIYFCVRMIAEEVKIRLGK